MTIERLQAARWFAGLLPMLNAYKAEIGEPPLNNGQQRTLRRAVDAGQIWFFVARTESELVGMCSVCPLFSTFSCAPSGIFEDFYVSPVRRHQGIARQLTQHVVAACKREGLVWLWVGASTDLSPMYAALGFSLPLGNLLCMPL